MVGDLVRFYFCAYDGRMGMIVEVEEGGSIHCLTPDGDVQIFQEHQLEIV